MKGGATLRRERRGTPGSCFLCPVPVLLVLSEAAPVRTTSNARRAPVRQYGPGLIGELGAQRAGLSRGEKRSYLETLKPSKVDGLGKVPSGKQCGVSGVSCVISFGSRAYQKRQTQGGQRDRRTTGPKSLGLDATSGLGEGKEETKASKQPAIRVR